jgi:hypothetical protein
VLEDLEGDQDRDIIIPWPIVCAGALFVGFVLLSMALVHKGATALDAVFVVRRPHYSLASLPDYRFYLRERLLALNGRFFCGFGAMGAASGLVLVRAFIASRRDGFVQFVFGPMPGSRLRRKAALMEGELLIAVLVALWLVSMAADVVQQSTSGRLLPNTYAVAAIAFWGTLVRMAWGARWNWFWRWTLTAFWLAVVLFEIFFLLYFGVYITTIAASMVLGVVMLYVTSWWIDTRLTTIPSVPQDDIA